ncbi:MAG TPA: iron-containing alcohol dehydrogenase, partial [Aliiroseovarius sp.]|nr:iron-containing alcohol dehydrogenase [Aliiroseovarius sp.]
QGIALEGMRLVREYLPRAYKDGTDIEARANMLAAGSMGAVAFQKGLGVIHALSHPVGAVYGTHHGTTNAVVMPACLRFNRPAIEDKIAHAADYLGITGGFDGFLAEVEAMNDSLGIPKRLSEMGVATNRIDELTRMALEDPSVGGNPVEMTFENTRALFQEVI